MKRSIVLKLVDSQDAHASAGDVARKVFEHWVWMLGKPPNRTAFGPSRRKTVDRALELYDADTLMLAIEGCAASAWHNGENDRRRPFNDIELILRDEPHIERFAEEGEALRAREEQARSAPVEQATQSNPQPDAAQVQAQRERLREMAAALAGRRMNP